MKRMMNFFLPAVLAAALSLPGGCGRKEPPGAVVNITGPEGLSVGCGKQAFTKPPFELKMPPGSYLFKFTAPGYAPKWQSVVLKDQEHRRIAVELEPALTSVLVATRPAGAELVMGSRVVGATPYSGEFNEGKYRIRLEAPGFLPLEQVLTLNRGEELPKTYKLTPKPGGIDITSEPAGAEIFVNDVKQGVTPCTVMNLTPAVYRIRAVKQGYDVGEKTIQIAAGFSDSIRFKLVKSTGAIILNVQPAGIHISLDGKPYGKSVAESENSTGTKPILINSVAPGRHVVTVSHPRAMPSSRDYVLEVQKEKVINRKIDVWVANCEIKFKDTGRVELGALFEESEKAIFFGTEPGVRVEIDRAKLEWVRKLKIDEPAGKPESSEK